MEAVDSRRVRFLKCLETHRRTVLDCLAITLFLVSAVVLGLAVFGGKLGELNASDLVEIGSVFAAAAGVLLGIGGSRRDM